MSSLIALFAVIYCLLASPTVQAWNKPTHMVSAAIAYAELKERNPDVLIKVIEVLKQHPHFNDDWAPNLEQVSADERDLYLFMLAAKWSDDVRTKHKEYNRPAWHYVNIPYRPGEAPGTIPPGGSIISAFWENRSTVQSAAADDKARAVALCWMLHLIGDIHQPLHTVKLVTEQFPEGDRGGTRFYVLAPSGKTISLHKLWDDLIIGPKTGFRGAKNEATLLRNQPDLKRMNFAKQLAVKPFDEWAVETYNTAVERAYNKGTLQGSNDKNNGVVLPSDYPDQAKETAERQIVLSGYRISDAMVEVFSK